MSDSNLDLVRNARRGSFIDRDPSVVDRYFAADYKQHNPTIPNGPEAISALIGQLPTNLV